MRSYLIIFFLLLILSATNAQDSKPYQEKFVETNEISLHYLDFGGNGLPIIFLQDFHDDATEWVKLLLGPFAPRFSKTNRVFAITRRGWGKSSDPGWGFEVSTQAEDAIAFMDALKIDKAVFVGRVPACQDMTYIAEHHPQRVAGLVYWNAPFVPLVSNDSLLWQFKKIMMRMACDVPIHKAIPRSSWQPHYLKAKPGSIAIPAMYFSYGDSMDLQSFDRRFFEVGMMMAKQAPSEICDSTAREYFLLLAKNPELQNSISKALEKADRTAANLEAFKKAFTPTIKMAMPNYKFGDEFEKYWKEEGSDFYFKHISEFIVTLKK